MRYQNWDVLLFPDGSKIPIQEFKTQCFVTKDLESPFLRNASVPGYPFVSDGKTSAQLPVLTTFVASLMHNAAFRVSVHSWEKPRPSRATENLMQPDDFVMFEARVYVDGRCVSGSIFSQRTQWPHVIDSSSQLDKNGNQDALRFPPFHQEILQQNHWDAAESLGRIRVVIAEGCSRPHRSPPFERVRDVLVFSFQHAPLHILEFSGIAWPNPGMWSLMQPRNIYGARPINTRQVQKEDEDAHAHSPSRRSNSSTSIQGSGSFPTPYLPWGCRPSMPPPGIPWHAVPDHDAVRSPALPMPDPFVDNFTGNPAVNRRGGFSSIEDVPMPDYVSQSSSTLESRAASTMTDVSYEQKRVPKMTTIDDETINQLVEALSPMRQTESGTLAPTNTPSSVPHLATKPSAAAEARSASYPHTTNRKVSLEVHSLTGTREVSEGSAKSLGSDGVNEILVPRKTHASPCSTVKGKKEGKGGKDAEEHKENEAGVIERSRVSGPRRLSGKANRLLDLELLDTVTVQCETKRKRSLTTASDAAKRPLESVMTPSPSKKTSKMADDGNGFAITGEDSGEGGVSVRTPLQDIGGSID